jgi:Domain of unknown function (DUF4386)
MSFENETGRQAGVLYLIVVVTGIFSLAYVPSRIPLSGDASAVTASILASLPLFRLGIAAFIVKQVAFLLLPLALYRLFRPTDRTMATLMVALAVVSVPIALVSLAGRLDALSLLTDPRYSAAMSPQQLQAEVMLAVASYRNGMLITTLFWGLWLFPFGYLVVKSALLPRVLGVLLILGSFGYAIDVFGELLAPGYSQSGVWRFVTLPASVGEIGTCLWLLIAGVRRPRQDSATATESLAG